MIGGTDVYEGNNESARSLSKAYQESGESEKGPVVGHTVMFYKPMEMFEKIPFNDPLKEKSWVHLKASEGETSTYYTFLKKMQGGSLIKLLDTYITADIALRTSASNKLSAGTICDYAPRPLTSWWKSVSHTDNLIVSSIFSRLFERKNGKYDLAGCNMGLKDTYNKMRYLTAVTADNNAVTTRGPIIANTGAKKRIDSVVNADP